MGLAIVSNDLLNDLSGFEALSEINSEDRSFLIITDNKTLTNIDGLSGLGHIYGVFGATQLIVERNPMLKNVDGLISFTHFYSRMLGMLSIADNAKLENIDGLSNFRPAYQTNVRINVADNPSLSKCSGLSPFFEALGWETTLMQATSGMITLENNGSGCTVEDLLLASTQAVQKLRVINTLNGQVIDDFNLNGVVVDRSLPSSEYFGIEAVTCQRW